MSSLRSTDELAHALGAHAEQFASVTQAVRFRNDTSKIGLLHEQRGLFRPQLDEAPHCDAHGSGQTDLFLELCAFRNGVPVVVVQADRKRLADAAARLGEAPAAGA